VARNDPPDQGWDISIVLGGAAIVLAIVLSVPTAKFITDKLHERKMRQHFSDTRGRRRRIQETGYWDDTHQQ
jgi:hypothetical protein